MVYDQANASHLKPWLVRTLEPICDAEPGALADYILALLKHNAPETEMRAELGRQLEEFLENECAGFIDTLFTALRTKSYLPYTATPSSPSGKHDGGIPIPIDVLLPRSQGVGRGRKRSNSNDEADGRPPKGARLNHESQFSRFGDGGAQGWGRPGQQMMMPGFGMPMPMGMNGMGQMGGGRRQQGYQPPDQKRGICRDYHNNGYCARGAMCKYSHGDDAVVPGQLYPMNMPGMGMPFMPMFPGNGMPFMSGPAYDPHEARMDMRAMPNRPPRAPLLQRVQQEDGTVVQTINASGELPVIQDLTPVIPRDTSEQSHSQQQPQRQHPPTEQTIPDEDIDMRTPSLPPMDGMGGGYNPMMGHNGQSYPQPMQDIDGAMSMMSGMRPPTLSRGGYRGRGGGGRGRGGTFPDAQGFRPEKRNDKTLVVEKIPEEKLTLEQVNDWFKRFGTVTNVAIDATTAKALVSFENHQEAHAAWKAEEAVFGNRFVKVFWHRPMEGHGQAGARMLAASAPLVANMGVGKPGTQTQTPPTVSTSTSAGVSGTTTPRKQSATPATTSAAMSALAAKQQKLEQTIAEQKTLMAALDSASPEEKKEIMAKLRKLGEEQTKLTTAASEEASAVAAAKKAPSNGATEKERLEKERLDQELDMHGETTKPGGEGESTEDLKAKLERLKAEASSLGLDAALPSSAPAYRGGYRGRARGAPRGYYRGGPILRGGPPRGSMKLDNRPKRLLVKGVSEENTQALRDWYETTGQLESVEPSGTDKAYIVTFRSRSAAEQGLTKGSNIPIVGPVQISWFTGPASTTQASSSSVSRPAASEGVTKTIADEDTTMRGPTDGATDYAAESNTHEEEIVAAGWGGGDEDGDGMGML